jgi:hypothetical protein
MSMTPYEIRLELLKMAKDMLEQDYHAKREGLQQQWHTQVDSAKIAGTQSPDFPALPPFPTEEEIVKKAEALNQFVSQTNPTPQPEVKIKSKSNS